MTLLLDPTCGGNGWSLAIFFEFDNAHRIHQWTTGGDFDLICPMRMAHFAAMSANAKLRPSFLDSGAGSKRARAATSSRVTPSRAPKGHCYVYHNTGACSKANCEFATSHRCSFCNGGHAHAPGTCPSNPDFKPPLPPGPAPGAPYNSGSNVPREVA
jgi:hypothetical protein